MEAPAPWYVVATKARLFGEYESAVAFVGAKGVGSAARGTGKAAGDLVTLHPVNLRPTWARASGSK